MTTSTPACSAAGRGDLGELQRLYSPGGELQRNPVAAIDPTTGETPLHAAARGKHLEVLDWLLAYSGFDLQARAKNGESAAHLAAFEGWLEGIQALVDFDADRRVSVITDRDLQGLSVLDVAIIRGKGAVVAWICDEFSADSLRLNEKGSLAVHYAAGAGNVGILSLICEHVGSNAANQSDENNATPVYFAAQEGRLEAIKYLVTEGGADPKAKTSDGMQALHTATQNGHEEVVQWLVARIGKTALMETTDDGATAVHFAAAAGHVSLLRWFFSTPNGSSLALVRDNMNSTPLHDAMDYGHKDCLKVILKSGGDLFATDQDGVSPYSMAMDGDSEEMKSYIIKYIQDKHLSLPDVTSKKSGKLAKTSTVSHPVIPRHYGASEDEADDGGIHPVIPKGNVKVGGGNSSIRTLMTMSEEIQAAQQEVMAHKLTSVLEAASSTGPTPTRDTRTRPMRKESFRDLKPSGPPRASSPPAETPMFNFKSPPPPGPPPEIKPDAPATKDEEGDDSRPSPDGEEKGPLSQEVSDWFASPKDEAEIENRAAGETTAGNPSSRLSWPSDDDTVVAGMTASDFADGKVKVKRSKRRKLQHQVPRYKIMPVYQPVMTPYGYMLAQTVMPVPVKDGARGQKSSTFNKSRPPRSGNSSDGSSDGAPTPSKPDPSRRHMKRKDSGRLPVSPISMPSSLAKSLASVNEAFDEDEEEAEEEEEGMVSGGGGLATTPTGLENGNLQRKRKLSQHSRSLTGVNMGGAPGTLPMSTFSPYDYMLPKTRDPQPKQASFFRWLINKPPSSSKSPISTQSSTSIGEGQRRASFGGNAAKRRSTTSLELGANDFMIGLDEQSYDRGSVHVALAVCTSVIGMSIVSAVPKKSILPMMAGAAQRAMDTFGLGETVDLSTAQRNARQTPIEATSSGYSSTQHQTTGNDQAKAAGATAKTGKPVSRKISIRRAASTPELDKDAQEARKSSVWEFDQKMETKASQRWGHDETTGVDLDQIASLRRQGPKDEAQVEKSESLDQAKVEEKKRKEEAAERARLQAEEARERKEEEKAQKEVAKQEKREAERRRKEEKEEEQRRKKEEELAQRQEERMKRKQSKEELKLGKEQRKKEEAAKKAQEAEDKKKNSKESKEAEKQRKLAEKKQKEEEKERRKAAEREEKKRNQDDKKRKQQEERLRKEDEARRKKSAQLERRKSKRDSVVSGDTAAAAKTEEFLGQWESAIKTETGNISSVLDDLQATIDMDGQFSEMFGSDHKKPVEDPGVSELALALQLSGQAEILSETLVYEEETRDQTMAWQSSAAFDASAAAAVLSSDAALEEVTRRPSRASASEVMQPSHGQLGRSAEPIEEVLSRPDDDTFGYSLAPALPPPAAPPNLLNTAERDDHVGFLGGSQPKPSEARKLWQQRSFSSDKEGSAVTASGSSTALHSMLSGSKTDLAGSGGGRPGGADGKSEQSELVSEGASELEYALNQRRKKAQNAFLSNYRKSVDH